MTYDKLEQKCVSLNIAELHVHHPSKLSGVMEFHNVGTTIYGFFIINV